MSDSVNISALVQGSNWSREHTIGVTSLDAMRQMGLTT